MTIPFEPTFPGMDIQTPQYQTRPMSQKVFDKICELMSLPEDADELDLLIAITKLVEKQPKTTITRARDTAYQRHTPDFDVPA